MRYGLILGDQLSEQIATLKVLDKDQDLILMAELVEEAMNRTGFVGDHFS